ncbi:hypothetical protein O987_12342 [Comamonas testosteroni TK102]|uniref:Bacterial EndoU nuclease domain-containing protein n=1 Tax=Comamonas testosteroni TK102 TaxID=1392005 RepID=A0A076PPM0_COMTE|nr:MULTISPECIES: EndoU domain-containing protein [Comamonas]AIJ46586.1 hypothetical protein O987_12342 [Comamonas testosteroni TK102]
MQREIDAQVAITAEFGKQATKTGAQYAQDQLNKASGLREIAKLEADQAKRAAILAEAAQIESAWKDGGTNRVLMHTGIGLLTGGAAGAVGAAGSAAATPQLFDMLHDTTLPQPVRDALLLTAGAAIGAAAGGVEGAVAGANEMANNGLGTVVKRLGLGGVALCLKTPGCLALTGATGLELSRLANLAMKKNPGMSEDGAYAIAVADYLEEQVRERPTTPPPVPNHTGNDKPVNPTPEGSSTECPAEGPKEGAAVGGKPLDPQKPEDSILPGKPADPLQGIGPVFSEGNNYSPKAPIDFDGHVIGAEVKPNGSVVGGQSTALGNVRVILGTESAPNAYGVYMAEIEVADPSNPGKYLAKTNNNGISTMFPKSWSSEKIKMEISGQ